MMTCKQAAMLMSTGELEASSWRTRATLWLHLSMCRHCRAFKRQIDSLAKAGQSLWASQAADPPGDFETRLVERLTKSPDRPPEK